MFAEADGETTVGLLELRLHEVDRRRADEAGDKLVGRPVVEDLRCVDLEQVRRAVVCSASPVVRSWVS